MGGASLMVQSDLLLAHWVATWLGRPFVWGETDCNQLCLSWLDELTGGRRARDFRGRYRDRAEAIAFQIEFGQDLAGVLDDAGGREVQPRFAQTGDFLLTAEPGEPWLRGHVHLLRRALSSVEGRGVLAIPTSLLRVEKVVRVPCRPRS